MKKAVSIFSFLLLTGILSAQINYTDISDAAGIKHIGKNEGVAFGDYNKDGLEDIYVSQNGGTNALFRNNGDGSFTDVAAAAGINYSGKTISSLWGDLNNDGWLDLYLANCNEANVLYLNNGDGTFSDVSNSANVAYNGNTRSIVLGDLNMDGWLDIYVGNVNEQNNLYLNNGDGTFTDQVLQAGVPDLGIAMACKIFDYDNDGDPDLYLTHDANQPYILYQNDGLGKFTNVSRSSGANYAGQGMGTDVGDFNNDGWLDIYVTNLYENILLQNNGDGTFTEMGNTAGIDDAGMGWGITWLDYDNDGWQDIYISNDYSFSPAVSPNQLYHNQGDGSFEVVSVGTVLQSPHIGYGTACADINNDGKADLFVANKGTQGNQLFLNQNETGNWVSFKLQGTQSNYSAIGARITLKHTDGSIQLDEVSGGSGYAGQNSLNLHFGLGSRTAIDEMEVRWPSGLTETYNNVVSNKSYTLIEGQGLTTSVKEALTSSHQLLVATPSQGQLIAWLSATQSAQATFSLIDVQGRNLLSWQQGLVTGQNDIRKVLPELHSGMYYLQIQLREVVLVKPVVVLD